MFEIFIRRPILSGVISVVIVFLGLLAITSLPITQFPDIVPPSVTVTARYTGANADVMAKTVATPLERAINGVPGMTYMTSVCTNDGMSLTTIYFKTGTDPDVASVNVQNRVTTVLDELPEEVIRAGVITEKEVNSMLMYLNIMSTDSSHTEKFVYNFADINILRELKRIDGVGLVEIMGSRDYAMRVWLNPNRLAAYNLSPQEVTVELARETAMLEPFGTGNPPPVFGLMDAELSEITPVGGGKHLRLTVTKDSRALRCMRFGVSPEDFPYRPGDRIDLAFSLEEKEFMGKPELSVIVRELLPAGADSGALLRSRARYEAARRGAVLPPAVWEEQFPTRDSFALLYRFLREANGFSGEAEALWMRCGGRLPFGRLLLCLDVLSERGLIQLESSGSYLRVRLLPASGKVDLFSSKLLAGLKKSE